MIFKPTTSLMSFDSGGAAPGTLVVYADSGFTGSPPERTFGIR
jgi:hypothetical protein